MCSIDDTTPAEVSARIGVPVVPVEIDGADLLAKILRNNPAFKKEVP